MYLSLIEKTELERTSLCNAILLHVNSISLNCAPGHILIIVCLSVFLSTER